MLLPHSGAVPPGTCGREVLEHLRRRRPRATSVDASICGEQARLRVHLAHEVVHRGELVGVGVDDEVDAVVDELELASR